MLKVKKVAKFVAVFVALFAMLWIVIVGGFLWLSGGPFVYVGSGGEVFEAAEWVMTWQGDKLIVHSATWAKAHRNECETVPVSNDYQVHSTEWVD